ncbi:MAG: hypothetical protein Q9162_003237 [Coniocarpon cinnabarinum]
MRVPSGRRDDSDSQASHESQPYDRSSTPEQYREEVASWFKPRRFFCVWAPQYEDIHMKSFILLDSSNSEGKGVLIKRVDKAHVEATTDADKTHMRLCGCRAEARGCPKQDEQGVQTVHLDKRNPGVEEDTYILLEHTHNIPFNRYKCVDRGVVSQDSFKQLRVRYVGYVLDNFGLFPEFMEEYDLMKKPD